MVLFLILFILVVVASFALPWWVLAPICFFTAFWLARSGRQAFWSAFTAVFLAWVALALFKSIPNDNILADRIAHLFFLPNWMAMLLITGMIGGLVGGVAGLSGYYWRQLLSKKVQANAKTKG